MNVKRRFLSFKIMNNLEFLNFNRNFGFFFRHSKKTTLILLIQLHVIWCWIFQENTTLFLPFKHTERFLCSSFLSVVANTRKLIWKKQHGDIELHWNYNTKEEKKCEKYVFVSGCVESIEKETDRKKKKTFNMKIILIFGSAFVLNKLKI